MLSIDFEEIEYPIIIEIPKDYWTYSTNKIEEKEEE